MNTQDWSPLGWTGWISLQSKGLSRDFSNTTVQKHPLFGAQLSHLYMTTGKTIALTRQTFVGKVTSLLFNMMSRLVITFLPRASVLILWLQSWSAVILEPPKIKSVTVSTVFPSIWHEVMGPDVMILVFWMLSIIAVCKFWRLIPYQSHRYRYFLPICGLSFCFLFPLLCKSFWVWVGPIPGEGNGNPLQYSCLENPMDGGAW